MYGLWCLLGLVVISGSIGGLIFSLSSDRTHTVKLPFAEREADSGAVGHIIIGIGGAIVAITAGIPIFNLEDELALFDRIWTADSIPPGVVLASSYITAIGVIGGFSGLRIISGLSDAMLQKILNDVEQLQSESKELDANLQRNFEEDQRRQKQLEETERHLSKAEEQLKDTIAKNELLTGLFLIDTGDVESGISRITNYLDEHPDHPKAWIWLARGYKRIGKIEDAIMYAQKALELEPTDWLAWFNKACYLSLKDEPEIGGVVQAFRNAYKFVPRDRRAELLADLEDGKDCDFDKVRTSEPVRKLIEELKAES